MRRIHARLAVPAAALALLFAAGCGGGSTQGQSSSESPAGEKGTLTLGATADTPGWDPSMAPGYQGCALGAVWDTLVNCDANGKATPNVADTFEVTNGNKTFKAHIREGQKFSDGTPVDSAAVKA